MLVVLLALLLGAAPALADPGDLDTSFGDGGVARVPLAGGGVGTARDGVIQADGKVVIVGGTDAGDFAITRVRADGTLDPGFSGDGRLTLTFGDVDVANAVAQQPDGKLLVAGRSGCRTVVVRLTAAGELDPGFSATDFGFGCSSPVEAMALQNDGRIVLAIDNYGRWAVRRLLATGARDLSFANGELANAWTVSPPGEVMRAMTVSADGKITVAGSGGAGNVSVKRWTASGSADTAFRGNGSWTAPAGTGPGDGRSVVSAGSAVLVGGPGGIIRLTAAGALDPAFSGDGFAALAGGASADELRVLADGRLVFADGAHFGRVTATGAVDLGAALPDGASAAVALADVAGGAFRVVTRHERGLGYTAATVGESGGVSGVQTTGAPEFEGTTTFTPLTMFESGDGLIVAGRSPERSTVLGWLADDGRRSWSATDVGAFDLLAAAAAPDGAIVTTGRGSGAGAELRRYTASGVLDQTFGAVRLNLDPTGLAVQDDGRVLVAGMMFGALRIERYMADGRLDPTFAAAGRFELPWPPYGFYVGGLAIDTDGSIVISGGSEEMALVRLTPDGVLDTTFSGDGIATPLRWSSNSVLPLGWELTPVPGGYLVGSARQLVRVGRDGELDWDFVSDIPNQVHTRAEAGGGIVVPRASLAGRSSVSRIHPDGSQDTAFGLRFLLGTDAITEPLGSGATAFASVVDGRVEVRRLLGNDDPPPPLRAVLKVEPSLGVYAG